MTNKRRRSGVEVLDHLIPPTAEDLKLREQFDQDMQVAELIYAARTEEGLTMRELAEKIGTTASVIARLEDADYEGHSMSMLKRVAKGLNRRVEVRMPPIDEPPKQIPA